MQAQPFSRGRYAGIHPVHVSRYFTLYTGCPPGDYLRSIRTAKALTHFSPGTFHKI